MVATDSTQLAVSVITPEETVVEATASFLALPLFDGEIGIQPNHSPMIGRLGFGELRLQAGLETQRFYVDGGFVQVQGNQVSILTDRALPLEKLDAAAAEEQLVEGLAMPGGGPVALALRERTVMQARAQIRLARSAK